MNVRTSGSWCSLRAMLGPMPFPTASPGYWSSTISREGAWKSPTARGPRKAPISIGVIATLAVKVASITNRALA